MSSASSCLLLHPKLADCRRLFLRNYELKIKIGVHDFEKRGAQRVVVNVDLFVPLTLCTPIEDKLSEVMDYEFIHIAIAQHVAHGHIHLLETLCDDIARLMLAHPLTRGVRVMAEKPDVYPDSEAVGVEIFKLKND